MSNYHGRIINIPCDPDTKAPEHRQVDCETIHRAYKFGHRGARHAACEIAAEADAEIARLRKALKDIIEINGSTGGAKAMVAEFKFIARNALAAEAGAASGEGR